MISDTRSPFNETNGTVQKTVPRDFLFVNAEWLSKHLANSDLRLVEVDYDPESTYGQGHIPNAQLTLWIEHLSNKNRTDILDRNAFEAIMSRIGATSDTTIVLYGDIDNMLAIFAFWIFQYYGHDKVKILDGGRESWVNSGGFLTKIRPASGEPSEYVTEIENVDIKPDLLRAAEQIERYLNHGAIRFFKERVYAD